MSAIKGFAARLRALFSPRATETALNDEIQFHLEQETEKNLRLGMSPRRRGGGARAVRRARRRRAKPITRCTPRGRSRSSWPTRATRSARCGAHPCSQAQRS